MKNPRFLKRELARISKLDNKEFDYTDIFVDFVDWGLKDSTEEAYQNWLDESYYFTFSLWSRLKKKKRDQLNFLNYGAARVNQTIEAIAAGISGKENDKVLKEYLPFPEVKEDEESDKDYEIDTIEIFWGLWDSKIIPSRAITAIVRSEAFSELKKLKDKE